MPAKFYQNPKLYGSKGLQILVSFSGVQQKISDCDFSIPFTLADFHNESFKEIPGYLSTQQPRDFAKGRETYCLLRSLKPACVEAGQECRPGLREALAGVDHGSTRRLRSAAVQHPPPVLVHLTTARRPY